MSLSRDTHTLVIKMENVSPADAIALKKMFEYMEFLGSSGMSRNCTFYADGDGSFRPKVNVDYPIELPEVEEVRGWDNSGNFKIDSDEIAWKVYHDE